MNQKEKLSKDDGTDRIDQAYFRSMIGCLMYLTTTRLDILNVVSILSRFIHCASEMHLKATKRVIRYVKGTYDFGIKFTRSKEFELVGFLDSDWGGSIDDTRISEARRSVEDVLKTTDVVYCVSVSGSLDVAVAAIPVLICNGTFKIDAIYFIYWRAAELLRFFRYCNAGFKISVKTGMTWSIISASTMVDIGPIPKLDIVNKLGNIGVEMVEKMRGSKPTKMKYRELEPCILESPVRSKKHACLFGSPKFPLEMELSDMRRRQSCRTSAPLLSTENDCEVVDGSGRREKVGLLRSWLRLAGLEEK
ncbi:Retrovirus-related Pol polyprotein from transposon RE1 [Vitis vinifera]|uniref:Retrovirus-related Pol polyprotein from transposon RE1 n=1 Tax=Vitis vinifera TaxID=29760 RepID=A0A438KQI4_VITVI|nr:Retrovirus-related Pol polyprotein from transposon RE1 [Vitis vinifera]